MRAVPYLLALFGASALAHMEMRDPYPFRSKFNPDNSPDEIDYSMTNPLATDGSNFPCKGYHDDGIEGVTATYDAGGSYSITLAGSARHSGGSCQISLSYDNGATFKVIKSIMGGCPLVDTYNFRIPPNAPSGKALLAWTWYNLVGNRELYMNCAPVQINGSGGGDISSLPDMWIANVGNGCKTVEGRETVFANPGEDVEYGGSVTPSSPPFPNC
ncbi:hypothetical protein VTO42DRAFT_5605 [Malbranchea cinnamomea]